MATSLDEQTPVPQDDSPPVARRTRKWWFVGGLLLLTALLLGIGIGFPIGTNRSGVVQLTGRASVGDHVATIQVDERVYGLSGSVAWIDSSGSFHPSGWPACLVNKGHPTIRFGAVSVTPANTFTYRAVVYVDCRPA